MIEDEKTEAEAKNQACPHLAPSIRKDGNMRYPEWATCLGSACSQWRWAEDLAWRAKLLAVEHRAREDGRLYSIIDNNLWWSNLPQEERTSWCEKAIEHRRGACGLSNEIAILREE